MKKSFESNIRDDVGLRMGEDILYWALLMRHLRWKSNYEVLNLIFGWYLECWALRKT